MNESQLQEIIERVEANPVLSMHHQWTQDEQAEYDSLANKGRRLYDNLRTQESFDHEQAYTAAAQSHGFKQYRF